MMIRTLKTLARFNKISILFTGLCILATAVTAQNPERFSEAMEAFQKKDAAETSYDGSLLFVGSSSIRMWEGLGDAFPEYDTLNRGFGGSHFSDVLYWFDPLFLSHQPQGIFIYEGDNDIASGKTTARIFQDAYRLVHRLHNEFPETPVGLIAAKPSLARWHLRDQYVRLNQTLASYADTLEWLYFIDVWYPALNEKGNPRESTFLEDGIHMNPKGYSVWRKKIHGKLEEMGIE